MACAADIECVAVAFSENLTTMTDEEVAQFEKDLKKMEDEYEYDLMDDYDPTECPLYKKQKKRYDLTKYESQFEKEEFPDLFAPHSHTYDKFNNFTFNFYSSSTFHEDDRNCPIVITIEIPNAYQKTVAIYESVRNVNFHTYNTAVLNVKFPHTITFENNDICYDLTLKYDLDQRLIMYSANLDIDLTEPINITKPNSHITFPFHDTCHNVYYAFVKFRQNFRYMFNKYKNIYYDEENMVSLLEIIPDTKPACAIPYTAASS